MSLFAAMDVASGAVAGETYRRHRHQEVLRFFRKVESEVPKGREIHIIPDNCATRRHAEVRAWAERTKRVHFHFIPTSSSWLNLVERFFDTLTRKQIRRGVFHSVAHLESCLKQYIDLQREPPAVRVDEVGGGDPGEGGPGPEGTRGHLRIVALYIGNYTRIRGLTDHEERKQMVGITNEIGPMRLAGIVVVLLGVTPLGGDAQPVAGIVSERESGIPVVGAMVILFDDQGNRVDRFLTDAAGRFVLRARDVGEHYVTVERIGYAGISTDRFEPGSNAELVRIEVPVEPVALSTLTVTAAPRCEIRPEEGQVTARVWEEARKALATEAWTREVGRYRYTLLRYQRTLDRYGRAVVSETEETESDLDAAFTSASPESLTRVGFVQSMPDSTTKYYAPDAEVMLSDRFLDTHCLAATKNEEGRIGISFRPTPGRSVPEIRVHLGRGCGLGKRRASGRRR